MNRLTNYLLGGLAVLLPAMIDSALKGMALLGLVGLAVVLLRGASAATRHLTWLLGIVGLLVLPLFSVILPDWHVLPAWASVSSTSAGAGLAAPELSSIAAPTAEAPTGTVMERTLPVTSSAPTSAKISAARPGPSSNLAGWLVSLWIVGTAFLTSRLVACFIWLRVASGRAEPVSEGRLADALAMACQQLAIHRSVKLSLDKRRIVPLVWGILRPHLILPEEARTWDTQRLRAVLLHELAHVKRHDLLALWLTQVACAIHWFNPLVWLAAWRLHTERERACDDLVLNAGVRASEYAEHLVHVATKLEAVSPGGALGMARPSRLEGRLLAVLNERLNRRAVTRTLALAALACGLGVVVPVAMLRAKAMEGRPLAGEVHTADTSVPWTGLVVRVDIAKDGLLFRDEKIVPLEALTADLRELQRTNPHVLVYIRAPADVAFAHLLRLTDALAEIPINNLSLSTKKSDTGEAFPTGVRQAEFSPDGFSVVTRSGDGTLRLWERELERATELRRQNLISEAEYDKAKGEVELRRAELAGDPTEVARIKRRRAEAELARMTTLHAQKLVSAQELDQARLAVDQLKAESSGATAAVARAEVDLAKAELAVAKATLKRMADLFAQKLVAQSQREVAESEVAKAEAKLRLAEARHRPFVTAKESVTENLPPNQGKKERLRQLLAEEIQIAQDEVRLVHEQHQAGQATLEKRLRADLDMLALQREMAGLERNEVQAIDLVRQQISALEELRRGIREQRKQGAATQADELKLRRQILSLQRQLAELE